MKNCFVFRQKKNESRVSLKNHFLCNLKRFYLLICFLIDEQCSCDDSGFAFCDGSQRLPQCLDTMNEQEEISAQCNNDHKFHKSLSNFI